MQVRATHGTVVMSYDIWSRKRLKCPHALPLATLLKNFANAAARLRGLSRSNVHGLGVLPGRDVHGAGCLRWHSLMADNIAPVAVVGRLENARMGEAHRIQPGRATHGLSLGSASNT
jgi:hypothetical protein